MITRITGRLVQLGDTAATVAAGPFEYEVLIPEFVRRQLQPLINQEVSLRTIEYLDGNPQQGRLTPRMVGFMNDAGIMFSDQVSRCTTQQSFRGAVDKGESAFGIQLVD